MRYKNLEARIWNIAKFLKTIFKIPYSIFKVIINKPIDLLRLLLARFFPKYRRLPLYAQKVIASILLLTLSLSLFSSYLYLFPTQAKAAWYDDSWSYRKRIDVTVTSSASDITNLQTLLTIDTTGITSKLQSSCQDLRFTNAAGKLLPYYIDTCSNNSSTNKVWVMLDLVPKNTTTYTIYMYYGNPSASAGTDSTKFDNVVGLTGYWPLNETSGTTANDVSVGSHNGTDGSGITVNTSGATVNTGTSYTNNGTGTVTITGFQPVYTSLTMEMWYKPNTLQASNTRLMGLPGGGDNGLKIQLEPAGCLRFYYGNAGTNCYTLSAGSWYHIAATYSGTTITLYVNGVQVLTGSSSQTVTATADFIITQSADGLVDDAKLYNTLRSATQILNDYNNTSCGGSNCNIAGAAAGTIKPNISFASEEKATSPIGYWKFDEGTGTSANDSTTNALNGTITGATWAKEDQCISGKCLYFAGFNSGNKVDLGSSTKLNPSNVTVSAWVRPTVLGTSYNYIVSNARDCCGTYNGYEVKMAGTDQFYSQIWNSTNAAVAGSTAATQGRWYYVTMTYDGSALRMYVNGVLESSTTTALGIGSPASFNTYIGTMGNGAGTYTFQGYIDEVKIYNYAQTSTQIKTSYSAVADREGVAAKLGDVPSDGSTLANGLVGYWKMDNNVSGNAQSITDSSGNANTGTTSYGANTAGMDCTVSGKYGGGCNFATDDRISVTDSSSISPTSTITLSAWINLSSITGTQGIFGKYLSSSTRRSYLLGISGGKPTLLISSDGTSNSGSFVQLTSNTTLSTSTWYHLVATSDQQNIKIYINGTLDSSTAYTGGIYDSTDPLMIGDGDPGFWYYNGKIDEARIYNRALSASEVTSLYNFAPGPVGYWKFDEGTGTSAFDSSTNTNTGTLTGSPTWKPGKYGKGLNFNNGASGTGIYVITANESNFDFSADFTISLWINLSSTMGTGYFGIIGKYQGDSTGWDLGLSNGRPRMALRGTSGIDPGAGGVGSDVRDNSWHHITVVNTNSSIRTYIDGILINTTSGTWTPTLNNASVIFGNRTSNGSTFGITGSLDDIKIYNYARTAGQIVEDMNGGHPLGGSPVSSPLGYWKFDEGYGSGASAAHNSGSGGSTYDGTVSNFASPAISTSGWTQQGKFGKALNFDASNDTVSISSFPALTDAVTLSVWIKRAGVGLGFDRIYDFSGAGNDDLELATNNSGDLAYRFRKTDTTFLAWTNSGVNIPTGSWIHVALTYDGRYVYVYKNGVLSYTGDQGSVVGLNVRSGTLQIGMGGSTNTEGFNGTIDEVKVYNAALTADQIKIDMNRGQAQIFGSTSDNSSYQKNAESQKWCIPGDSTSCAAPVGIWEFDERTGTTVNDSSGNGNTGTWNGTTTNVWTVGKVGPAGNFNGSDNYVNIPNSSSLALGSSFTVEFWFKINSHKDFNRIFAKDDGTTGIFCFERSSQATQCSWRSASGSFVSQTVIASTPLNTWIHVAMVLSGGNIQQGYYNGVQTLSGSTNVGSLTNTSALTIGTFAGTYLDGSVDGFRIYNYARTPAQIAWDYNGGKPVGWWKFDECQGTTAYDSSGNGNNGTITIAATGTQASAGTCTTSSTAWGNGATGKRNASLNFDGTNDYVDAGNGASVNHGTNNFSVSAWIKPNGSQSNLGSIIDKYSGPGYFISLNGLVPRVFLNDVGGGAYIWQDCGTTAVTSNQWSLLTVSFDRSSNATCYINGIQTGTVAISSRPLSINNSRNLYIGRESVDGGWFNGQIDDARIYNYALTSTQVKLLYSEGAARFGPTTGTP